MVVTIPKDSQVVEVKNIPQHLDNPSPVTQLESGPAKVKSKFSDYPMFGNTKVNLDEGKKLLCFFAPGCDHCKVAARQITQLSNLYEIPPVYIFFMNEEVNLIPEFFQEANGSYPYQILEIPKFWDLFGINADTPGVILLWNGNVIKFYEGGNANKFDSEDLRKAL